MVEVQLRAAHWTREARDAFERVERWNTRARPIAEQLEGCRLVEVLASERVVGRVALDRVDDVGCVVAAVGSMPGHRLVAVLPAIETMFGDVRAVEIETKRRGMVRALALQGYELAGFVMRKGIEHGRQVQ
ncbi:MAG TPA: hypothetical protein VGE10_01735 [Zeimonas sp.]